MSAATTPRQRLLTTVLVALLGFAVASCGIVGGEGDGTGDGPELPTFDYVIPAGSHARLEAGERLEILPAEMEAELNDTIQIVNLDDRPHILGPWFVGPGETLRQRFVTTGVFEGWCSVHPSGQFSITVNPASGDA